MSLCKLGMTGNRVPSTPPQTGEDQRKPLAMPSKPPPPPPVRRKGAEPSSFPPTPVRTASPPPAPARAAMSQPPPPPKRNRPPLASVVPGRAVLSQPPPPPSSRKQPSVPPPLPVQAHAPPSLPVQAAAPSIAPVSFTASPAVSGLSPWAAPKPDIVESELSSVERQFAPAAAPPAPPAPVVEAAPVEAAAVAIGEPPPVVQPPIEAAAPPVSVTQEVEEPQVTEQAAASDSTEDFKPTEEASAEPPLETPAEVFAASEESTTLGETGPTLEAVAPPHDEPRGDARTLEAPSSKDLDSNSDNQPTHVLEATLLRARLAQTQFTHVESSPVESSPVESSTVESSTVESSAIFDAGVALAEEAVPPQDQDETRPLAVEQGLELAPDGAQAAAPVAPAATKAKRDFSSIGSETPVVLSTPPPPRVEGATAAVSARRTWLPEAKAWSKKTLRATPRTLVISAPFVALFGIWAAHSLATHHDTPVANAAVEVAPTSVTTPVAPQEPAILAPPPSPATVVAPSPTPPPAPSVDAAELKAARAHGLPALEALAAKYPGDVQVGIALAGQQAHAQRFEAAVATVDQLLVSSPDSAQNGKVMGILWRAAQSPASEQTFVSLRKLGARGSDVAFDLAATRGVRSAVRERARAELSSHLDEGVSADTRVAAALLLAPDCSTRKALLERAGNEGGKRTRGLLAGYSRGAACTASSGGACNACLAGSAELSQALAKLNEGAKP
ncbi:MAG: hypothetical protein ABIQ16_03640 [Polyangiaceae bacterium]